MEFGKKGRLKKYEVELWKKKYPVEKPNLFHLSLRLVIFSNSHFKCNAWFVYFLCVCLVVASGVPHPLVCNLTIWMYPLRNKLLYLFMVWEFEIEKIYFNLSVFHYSSNRSGVLTVVYPFTFTYCTYQLLHY